MIGNWLTTLTEEQEQLVLITPMAGWIEGMEKSSSWPGCLVQAVYPGHDYLTVCSLPGVEVPACSWRTTPMYRLTVRGAHSRHVPVQYDYLCRRFGDERVNAATRNRILRNQLRRTLAPQLESVTV